MLDVASGVDLDALLMLGFCPSISTSPIALLETTELKIMGDGIGVGLR